MGSTGRVRFRVVIPLAVLVGLLGVGASAGLISLIGLFTNLFYYHRLSPLYVEAHAGPWAVSPWTPAVLVFGALVCGLAIRHGHPALRGHGIPEVMEAVLQRGSRIDWRVALLKPVTAALAIGTGSPFGAEGPIIQTAGALGSLVGQVRPVTERERKILLGCGAAAGMTCIFATPAAGVLLALELLVFEFSAPAIVPIACAAAVAAALRPGLLPASPLFPSAAALPLGHPAALAWVVPLGAVAGLEAVALTHALYWVEDRFERVRWNGPVVRPVLGAAAVGLIALVRPQVLGVGYDLIREVLAGRTPAGALASLLAAKAAAWLVALGSGTVGGVLAPLLLIAGSSGALLGKALVHVTLLPPPLVGLLFMSAVFGAGSRAVLTSAVFGAEVSGNYAALPALLLATGVAAAVTERLSPYNIMTGKLVRRGVVPDLDYFPARARAALAPTSTAAPVAESGAPPGR